MKRSIFLLMAIAMAVIFAGCEKEKVLPPDLEQDVLEDADFKGARHHKPAKFIGTSLPVLNPSVPNEAGVVTPMPNGQLKVEGTVAEWFEEASDWRISGKSVWTANYLWDGEPLASHGLAEGTCEIFVGLTNPDLEGFDPDVEPLGKWELSWTGEMIVNPDGSADMVAIACGVGTEGVVKGLRTRSVYTFDFAAFKYNTEGYIKHANKHKKRQRGDRH